MSAFTYIDNSNKQCNEKNENNNKIKDVNNMPVFSDMKNNYYHYLSEKQRKQTYSNSNQKERKQINNSQNHNHAHNDSNPHLHDDNVINHACNIQQQNSNTNYFSKTSKFIKDSKNKKSFSVSKPQIETEINFINNGNENNANYIRIKNLKNIYNSNKLNTDNNITNITNNIMNIFGSYNIGKGGICMKLNIDNNNNKNKTKNKNNDSKKRQISKEKQKTENNEENTKKNVINNKSLFNKQTSESKLIRSSSGYSFANNTGYTNSFLNGNIQYNPLGYTSTGGNLTENKIINFSNISGNRTKPKITKKPIMSKITKAKKNIELNGLFHLPMSPMSPHNINSIQDYLKNLYKYYGKNAKKNINTYKNNFASKNKNVFYKEKIITEPKDKKYRTKIKHDEVNNKKNSVSKNKETKNKKIEKNEQLKTSNNLQKNFCHNCGKEERIIDTPEELHFYYVTNVQNGKNFQINFTEK